MPKKKFALATTTLQVTPQPNRYFGKSADPDTCDKPAELWVRLSIHEAFALHGEEKLMDPFQFGLKTNVVLEKVADFFAKQPPESPVIARGFFGDGSFKLQVRNRKAADNVLTMLERLQFGFEQPKTEILEAVENICKNPAKAMQKDEARSKAFMEKIRRLTKVLQQTQQQKPGLQ